MSARGIAAVRTQDPLAARTCKEFAVDTRRDSGARQQVADHVRFDGERALVNFFAKVFHAASLPGAC